MEVTRTGLSPGVSVGSGVGVGLGAGPSFWAASMANTATEITSAARVSRERSTDNDRAGLRTGHAIPGRLKRGRLGRTADPPDAGREMTDVAYTARRPA